MRKCTSMGMVKQESVGYLSLTSNCNRETGLVLSGKLCLSIRMQNIHGQQNPISEKQDLRNKTKTNEKTDSARIVPT